MSVFSLCCYPFLYLWSWLFVQVCPFGRSYLVWPSVAWLGVLSCGKGSHGLFILILLLVDKHSKWTIFWLKQVHSLGPVLSLWWCGLKLVGGNLVTGITAQQLDIEANIVVMDILWLCRSESYLQAVWFRILSWEVTVQCWSLQMSVFSYKSDCQHGLEWSVARVAQSLVTVKSGLKKDRMDGDANII